MTRYLHTSCEFGTVKICRFVLQTFTGQVKMMFMPQFAEKGSTIRVQQEQAFVHFGDFLDQCEGELRLPLQCHHHSVYCIYVYLTLYIEEEITCKLEDVVIFFSGADRPPPLGFPTQPDLEFLDLGAILPTASTCSLLLRLPVCHSNYDNFKDAMMLAVHGNDGFGGP